MEYPQVVTLHEDKVEKMDDGNKEAWMMVPCHSAKRQKKTKQPVVATRFSKRINKDGVPIQKKLRQGLALKMMCQVILL